jgi:hypothetical protein
MLLGAEGPDSEHPTAEPLHCACAPTKDNGAVITSVCRRFVELCRRLGLFTQQVAVIDSSKFKAVNARDASPRPS